MKKEYFKNIDGLRTISCLAIIVMHVKANAAYNLGNPILSALIDSFTWLVYLFLMISGFGICSGYLEKAKKNEIDLEEFYFKRYKKILPFFIFLIIINVLYEFSILNIYDGLMESSLLYGLLPNIELNVIGVSWTLGVIFLFYMLFPFISVFLKTKKRAWLSLAVILIINFLCENYYFNGQFVNEIFTARHNFLYCLPLFFVGGIIYIYRNKLKEIFANKKIYCLLLLIIFIAGYFFIPNKINGISIHFYKCLIICALILSYSISFDSKLLCNKFTIFIGKISMEMYLAQMLIFRLIEKMGIMYMFGKNFFSFLFTNVAIIVLLIIFVKSYYFFKSKIFVKR